MPTEGLYGSKTASNLPRVTVAEVFGTFFLVLAIISAAISATLALPIAGEPADSLSIALVGGFVLIALVGALGHISGGHFNPAVTIGLAFAGKFPWKYAVLYVPAQFVGAVLASLTAWWMFGDAGKTEASLGATQPAEGVGIGSVFVIEAAVTFLLVLVIVSVATDDRVPASVAGIYVGLALMVSIMIAGPFTGGAVNPARALGPMLISGQLDAWPMYLIGPLIGGILAALFYDKVLRGAAEPSEADPS